MSVASSLATTTRNWTGVETLIGTGIVCLDETHLQVVYTNTLTEDQTTLVRGLHYSTQKQAGATAAASPVDFLPLAAMPAAAGTLRFTRVTPAVQPLNLTSGNFDPKALERELDAGALRDGERTGAAEAIQPILDALAALTATVQALSPGMALLLANEAEARGITEATKAMSALRVGQAIDSNAARINLGATNIAAAATVNLASAGNLRARITGAGASITSFGTGANLTRLVSFAGINTLVHNATSLILPGVANITTAAGDSALCTSDASGNWTVELYQRRDGQQVIGIPADVARTGQQNTFTNFQRIYGGVPGSFLEIGGLDTDASYSGNFSVKGKSLVGTSEFSVSAAANETAMEIGGARFQRIGAGNLTISAGPSQAVELLSVLRLPSYTVATLPTIAQPGLLAWASNARVNGQAAAAGTGCLVMRNATAWAQVGPATAASHPVPVA